MKLLILVLILMTTTVYAEKEGGNGGDVIACYDRPLYDAEGQIDIKASIVGSPDLKDYWEFDGAFPLDHIDMGPNIPKSENAYMEKVHYVIDRLSKVDLLRADRYRKRLSTGLFYGLMSRIIIPDIDDSPSDVLPQSHQNGSFCYERQIAKRIERPKDREAQVKIDNDLFKHLSVVHQAGLILHELMYDEDVRFGKAKDSRKTKWFNYLISSNYIDKLTDIENGYSPDYVGIIKRRQLDYSNAFRYRVKLNHENPQSDLVFATASTSNRTTQYRIDANQELDLSQITLAYFFNIKIDPTIVHAKSTYTHNLTDMNFSMEPTDGVITVLNKYKLEISGLTSLKYKVEQAKHNNGCVSCYIYLDNPVLTLKADNIVLSKDGKRIDVGSSITIAQEAHLGTEDQIHFKFEEFINIAPLLRDSDISKVIVKTLSIYRKTGEYCPSSATEVLHQEWEANDVSVTFSSKDTITQLYGQKASFKSKNIVLKGNFKVLIKEDYILVVNNKFRMYMKTEESYFELENGTNKEILRRVIFKGEEMRTTPFGHETVSAKTLKETITVNIAEKVYLNGELSYIFGNISPDKKRTIIKYKTRDGEIKKMRINNLHPYSVELDASLNVVDIN